MTDRDDDGLAGVLNLALTLNTGLSVGLMGTLLAKGVISPEEHRDILDRAASAIEDVLGPAKQEDNASTKALRSYVEQLRQYGPKLSS